MPTCEQLAHYALVIEQHYGRPMDIEGAGTAPTASSHPAGAPRDREEPGQGQAEQRHKLKGHGTVLAEGRAIGQKIGTGRVRLVHDIAEMDKGAGGRRAGHRHDRPELGAGDEEGLGHRHQPRRAHLPRRHHRARTRHPAVVGCGHATELLKDGTLVTVSCAEGDTGHIYDGLLEPRVTEVQRGEMPQISTKIMMNVGNPQLAFDFAQLPNEGVGLARLEFIINNNIGVHPKAILTTRRRCRPEEGRGERGARPPARVPSTWTKVAEGVATMRRPLPQAGHRAPVGLQEQRVPQADRRQPLRA